MIVLRDWLKEYCGAWIPEVQEMENLLTFHAFEIEETKTVGDHECIDIKVLPDRASDCLSHRGIARELSTLTGKSLENDPFLNQAELTPVCESLTATIHDVQACRRFSLALVEGVEVSESPLWLKSRLEALGQRSINNVVDATNYVMLALGQPLHAYDADKVSHENGTWHFGVRMAHEGEKVTTLTNDEYTLTTVTQLIVDEAQDVPLGIAGIKGGKSAEITSETKRIILEAANFDPQVTRKSSQILKLQTDASKRFENNISPELTPLALTEVVRLILDISHGTCIGYMDMYPSPQVIQPVRVTLSEINTILGLQLSDGTVEQIFTRLGFLYARGEEGWDITPPFERRDIVISEDVIAEVGRVYGYEHIEAVVPDSVPLSEINARYYYSEKIRNFLIELGFSEVITSSFRKKDSIVLQNALASDKGCLRSSLKENIREVLDRNMPNADLLGVPCVRVFEIGTVFHKDETGTDIAEHTVLALGVRTRQQGYVPKDDTLILDIQAKLADILALKLSGVLEKGVVEYNLTELMKGLRDPISYEPYVAHPDVLFTPYSTYPFVSRDIALWVPESIDADTVESLIRTTAGQLLNKIYLFDEFKKDGKISYAFRLIFQSMEETLTDETVGKAMDTVTNAAKDAGFLVR